MPTTILITIIVRLFRIAWFIEPVHFCSQCFISCIYIDGIYGALRRSSFSFSAFSCFFRDSYLFSSNLLHLYFRFFNLFFLRGNADARSERSLNLRNIFFFPFIVFCFVVQYIIFLSFRFNNKWMFEGLPKIKR